MGAYAAAHPAAPDTSAAAVPTSRTGQWADRATGFASSCVGMDALPRTCLRETEVVGGTAARRIIPTTTTPATSPAMPREIHFFGMRPFDP
ncbi:hypothetical protein GCM10009733_032670 [Nonomuraea maheshkhaliensis]|uniref:Uncharacterized protein n=1 Tax=Nonomuraea maheshkhaliensis TaxID=419590 RepID=A0ABP4R292_9ACTN